LAGCYTRKALGTGWNDDQSGSHRSHPRHSIELVNVSQRVFAEAAVIDQGVGLNLDEMRQTDGNLELLELFVRQYLDDPERFDHIPSGATLVLLPPEELGDSELRRANVQMAERLTAAGRDVVILTVGAQDVAEPEGLAGQKTSGSGA
jgi:hypothetical protein